MRFLADMGISMTTVEALVRAVTISSIFARLGGEVGLGRMPGGEIVDKARRESRIVLTMDLDFGDIMAASKETSPSVVLFRVRNQTPAAITPRLLRVIQASQAAMEAGAFITVQDSRHRLRTLPIA